MDDVERERLGFLLEEALALPPERRARFLEEKCGADTSLREELASLLAASVPSAGYFDGLANQVVLNALAAAALGKHESHGELTSGDIVAHYEVIERIGGGMGMVYKARDLKLGRAVALKFLPPALAADEAARRRLYAEARAASALDHPNIGAVYEIGEAEPGGLFIALAWYEGETLKKKLRSGPLPVGEALAVARQIATALAAAHTAGIIHRDVKPSNIIRTEQGTAKLVDFGIAKVAGAEPTREGSTPGTLGYMSPEQTRGDAIDTRTDVWRLGVVLYEMLAGRRPFRGENDSTLIHAIRHDEPEPVERQHPEIPQALAGIVARCLAKDPSQRYARAEDLCAELDALDSASISGQYGRRERSTRRQREPEASGVLARARRRPPRAVIVMAAIALMTIAVYMARREAANGAVSATAADRPKLAVLPFENRSGRAEDQYFTDGLHDEIRTRLSGVATLRVSSRTSVIQYRDSPRNVREIGRELGVNAVLEGAVQRAAGDVRVFVRLIDARNDTQIWSATYDRALDAASLFAIQREIAQSVAEALRAELTDAERARVARVPTTDLEAYRQYLIGRHYWNQRDEAGMESAVAHFQEALRRDPLYARAYAGLADVQVLGYGPAGPNGFPLAIAAARTALGFDPDLAEAHASLGLALTLYQWDWPAAERAFRRAIELDPSYVTAHQWYAEYLATQGRLDEAVKDVRIAESLDPLSPIIGWNVARILALARRYEEAVQQCRVQARLYPRDERINVSLVMYLMAIGHHAEAADVMERFVTSMAPEAGSARAEGFDGLLAGIRLGRGESVTAFLTERLPEGAHRRMFAAYGLAAAGEMDAAIRMIEQAHEQRAFGLLVPDLAAGALFDPFRDEERFQNVLRRMALDPRIGLGLRERAAQWHARQ
jgi:serine/threonine-protein kinase